MAAVGGQPVPQQRRLLPAEQAAQPFQGADQGVGVIGVQLGWGRWGMNSRPPALGGAYALLNLAYAAGLMLGPLLAGVDVADGGEPLGKQRANARGFTQRRAGPDHDAMHLAVGTEQRDLQATRAFATLAIGVVILGAAGTARLPSGRGRIAVGGPLAMSVRDG